MPNKETGLWRGSQVLGSAELSLHIYIYVYMIHPVFERLSIGYYIVLGYIYGAIIHRAIGAFYKVF